MSASVYETLAIERRDDGIAIVRLDRPEKLNAMNPAFFRELPAVLAELDADARVEVCVLTGAGRAFSAGGDIASFQELTDVAAYRRHLRLVYDAFHAVERAQVPVIAAVNGIAYGGGTELVLVCDLVIAARSARFAFREATVGLMPGWGVVRGPDVIGRHWTRWLALTADIVDAEQAQRIGLVQSVVEDGELLEQALAVAQRIRANAPLGVRAAKQFINRDTGGSGMAESIEATALLFTTDDHKARVAAFVDGAR
jgi:enoyl-CoA hydratase/carnithine racemase